ncbi:MAG: polyphenol oxidase family protein [Acidimicrobiales bacterium]
MPDTTAVPLLHWEEAAAYGSAVAVTTRHGGVSQPPYDTLNLGLHVGDRSADVVVNRTRAAAAFGVGLETTVFARQVHGASASLVGPGDRGRGSTTEDDAVPDTDILVTTSPGVTLVIMVADCVPLALVDPAAGVLAAVHAGWRGTAAGAAPAALRAMTDRGARPDRVRAFLGPAVAPDRYQVDATVHAALARAVGPAGLDPAVARADGPGHWLVDLVAANRQQLVGSGIRPEHIVQSGVTTDDAALFSDRATRPCGRFALMARLLD